MRVYEGLMIIAVCVILAVGAGSAWAIPVGGTLTQGLYGQNFDTGYGIAVVDSEVYQYNSGDYIYTYEVTNSAQVSLNFFSVGIKSGTNVWSPNIDSDPINNTTDPAFWTVSGSPPESVNYIFADTIDPTETTAVMWFVSDAGPAKGNAAMMGISNGMPLFANGDVLTPVPEPATIALFGFGLASLFAARSRKD